MNSPGPEQPARRVAPAHERLDAARGLAREADDRLVVQLELAALDGGGQLGAQLEPGQRLGVQRGVEARPAALAAGLGLVHGRVGVAQQLAGRRAGRRGRDADAGAHLEAPAGERHGRAQRARAAAPATRSASSGAADAARAGRRTRRRRGAPPCRRAAAARRCAPATSWRSSSPAAWPSESLTVLKSSRSTNSTRDRPAAARRRQRAPQAVLEQGAVGQAGERVVEGAAAQLLLERDAVGDVAREQHERADLAVVQAVLGERLERARPARPGPVTVAVNEPSPPGMREQARAAVARAGSAPSGSNRPATGAPAASGARRNRRRADALCQRTVPSAADERDHVGHALGDRGPDALRARAARRGGWRPR